MGRESEDKQLDLDVVRRGIEMLLTDPGKGVIFVAEDEGRIVGNYTIGAREWSEWRAGWIYWATAAFVVPECRRVGVKTALFYHACAWVKSQPNGLGLRSYIHRDNLPSRIANRATGMTETPYVLVEHLFQEDSHERA